MTIFCWEPVMRIRTHELMSQAKAALYYGDIAEASLLCAYAELDDDCFGYECCWRIQVLMVEIALKRGDAVARSSARNALERLGSSVIVQKSLRRNTVVHDLRQRTFETGLLSLQSA